MKTKSIYSFFFLIVLFTTSCIEHEVIPPPVNTVDLNCYFVGFVNGTQVEFTQNVQGYGANVVNYEDINPSPTLSHQTYGSKIKSFYYDQAIQLKFGTLDWDASANSEPTVAMFNDYHSTNSGIPINFSDNGLAGIEVEYTDNNGVKWLSRESDPGQEGVFTILGQASDNTGDYSLFECDFSCKVWRINPQTNQDESLDITNAKFTSWFKR
ncbi:MAG: hypothetical protein VX280_02880 [Bacteroidota bacterium]|nr:hypothetical protein [Bacteroidota bacterium]